MRSLLTAFTAGALATGASAQIIDFQVLEHVDNTTATHGDSYSEDGFTIRQDPGSSFELATFGTLDTRYPGSTAMFNNNVGGITELVKNDGGLFTLTSIDISRLNTSSPVSVTFTGELDGVVVATQTLTTAISDNTLETFSFGSKFLGVDRVTWTQDSPFHQFDNINVAPLGVQIVDFQGLAHNNNVDDTHGFSYSEDGFVVSTDPNNSFQFNSRGTQSAQYAGSTGLYNNNVGGVTELADINGRPFALRSIDLADLNNTGPVTIAFVGRLNGAVVANQSFTTSGADTDFRTFTFNNGFARVDHVSWSQDSPFHQFDNIRAAPVGPEIIDFERLRHDSGTTNHGYAYSEHGYTVQFDTSVSVAFEFASRGEADARFAGSTALFNNTVGGVTVLRRNDNARFNLISIDVANLGGTADTVRFEGYRGGVLVATQNYTMTNNLNELETVILNGNFRNLDSVEWEQDGSFNVFDNINVEPTIMIDFQALAHNDALTTNHGGTYSENGMTLRDLDGSPNLSSFGTKENRYPGSTAIFNNTVGGLIQLVHGGGDRFSVSSIDISPLNSAGAVTVSFVGRLNGNVVANQSFTTSGAAIRLETFFFNDDFLNVDEVTWSQDSPFHQVDNIVFGNAVGGCPADLDGDGDADADDFFAYLDAFAGGNLGVCDIDGDGDCDADDFFGYLDLFAQGC